MIQFCLSNAEIKSFSEKMNFLETWDLRLENVLFRDKIVSKDAKEEFKRMSNFLLV